MLGNIFQFFASVETNLFNRRRNNTAIHTPKSIWLLFHLFEHNMITYCKIKVYLSLICLKYSIHIVHCFISYSSLSIILSFGIVSHLFLCCWLLCTLSLNQHYRKNYLLIKVSKIAKAEQL